jgi:hypothetical protein
MFVVLRLYLDSSKLGETGGIFHGPRMVTVENPVSSIIFS